MNKIKKISIITIMLYMFFITSSFAATATVDVTAARLREEANTTSNVLTNIYKGEKVEILEKQGEWYKVKYGSKVGYLKNNLIKEDSASDVNTTNTEKDSSVSTYENTENTDSTKVIVNSNTNIRYQPNMMSNIIVQIESGKELTKGLELGKWIKVSDGAIEGWILKAKVSNQTTQSQVDSSDTKDTNTVTEDKSKITNTTNTVNSTNTTNTVNTTKTNTTNTANTTTNKVNTNTVENTVTETNDTQKAEGNKKGKVNVETAKVRKTASTTAKVVGFLDYNDEITIIAEEGEFYKFTEKSVSGYVHKSLITPIEENVSSRGTTEERIQENVLEENSKSVEDTTTSKDVATSANTTSKGIEVAELAKKYQGYKYVVGGKNPESGFDCSGFTRYIFLQFGYSLGSTAAGQNNLGVEVSRDDLKAGDLILFYDEGKTKIGHTGIYISGGDFIHSANPERGVVIDNINTNSYYNERYIVAKRIVE